MEGFFPLLLLMCALVQEGKPTEMEEVEELLNMARNIDLKNAEKLILLIGSTGTGKSTMAKFLTNDPTLQMVNISRTSRASYVFKDNGTISENIRKSMTILPNVYQDPTTNEIIVDCPGFSDTREPKIEIANAFFIKQVLEHPKKLKIVVTENHFSLVEGSDRFGFNRLLLALAELIPNIERFRGSMALVCTKAYPRENLEDVKSELEQFLANYRYYLTEDLNSKQNKTVEGMIKVLDVLAGNPPGNNIAFFWKPMIMKSYLVGDLMNNCKNNMRSLIFNQLTWADNTNAVYRYSVSKESRLFIRHELAPSNLEGTLEELQSFFVNLKSGAQSKIVSTKSAREGVEYMKTLLKELAIVVNLPLKNVHDISNITQRLAAVTQVKEFNADVFKYLATKAAFFKSFGVDVVDRLNKVMQSELASFGRWLSENLQNTLRLQALEEKMMLQAKEAIEAREKAAKAAKEVEERNKEKLEEVRRAMEKSDKESEARVAAAEQAIREAEERATRAEQDVTDTLQKLQASMKESKDMLDAMETNKEESNNDLVKIMGVVAAGVLTALLG